MSEVRYTHKPVKDANGDDWYRVEIESGESIYVRAAGVTIALTHGFDLIEYHANRLAAQVDEAPRREQGQGESDGITTRGLSMQAGPVGPAPVEASKQGANE